MKTAKKKHIFQLLVVVALLVTTVVSALQLPVVRDLFSRASSEPANITVDTQAVIGPMPRPWRYLAQGGEDKDWRLTPLANQVRQLKPYYIRIDHVFDFYTDISGGPGNFQADFSKLDTIISDIQSVGATPYISLSYMPAALGNGDITGSPTRYEDWQRLVQLTVQHISGTRGVRDVYYEVWNEPDLFGGWRYYGEKNYLQLYVSAARGAQQARGVLPYKIGGPATTGLYENWFRALADTAISENVPLDFISWHRYSRDLDQFRNDMYQAQTWLDEYPQLEPTTELHITEWGHDSENDAGYDTPYAAAHTVAGAIEMIGVVDKAFVFEIQDGKSPEGKALWGRWGMFTHQDHGANAKPRYQGLLLLDSLGEERLQLLGKGTFVKAAAARNGQTEYQVVLANYDPAGRNVETVPVTFQNIAPGSYILSTQNLQGQITNQPVFVEGTSYQTQVPLRASQVVKITLRRQ